MIGDPSHGTGKREYVLPMARAAVAAGADGLIPEPQPDPDHAISDGAQTLRPDQFTEMLVQVRAILSGPPSAILAPPLDWMETVAIVGVGLIGASFGLALRKVRLQVAKSSESVLHSALAGGFSAWRYIKLPQPSPKPTGASRSHLLIPASGSNYRDHSAQLAATLHVPVISYRRRQY